MAPANGMASFVQNRNGDVATDLNDLKLPTPSASAKDERKHKSKNTAAHREKSQPGRQSRNQGNALLKSNNSSVDNLSTTASTTRQRSGGDQRLETLSRSYDRHGTNGDQPDGMFGGTDYDEDPNADQDLPHDPMAERFQRMHAESRVANGSPTIAQTHIKGDSYPPTSAGVPSVTDHRDRNEVRASGGLHNLPTHAAQRSIYGARAQKPQLQPTTIRHQSPTAPHAQEQPVATSHQLQDTRPLDSEPQSDFDESANFAFGRPPTIKKEAAAHIFRPQKQAVSSRPLTPDVKTDAARPRREPGKQPTGQADPATNEHLASKEKHAYQNGRQPRVTEVQSHHEIHDASAGQALMFGQRPASDALTEEDPDEQPEPQVFREEPLDYDLEELYNKDYASLKGEPFDHSPHAQPFVIHGLPDTAILTDKLVRLNGAEPQTQASFFTSLNIDEWEEAGDWFLDRFGETIKRLKDVRREKRKAARAFEDEIEVRETAVSKKRVLTRAAMVEMKTSGAAVLQGTPGKKR
jgi:hypothetical protein